MRQPITVLLDSTVSANRIINVGLIQIYATTGIYVYMKIQCLNIVSVKALASTEKIVF